MPHRIHTWKGYAGSVRLDQNWCGVFVVAFPTQPWSSVAASSAASAAPSGMTFVRICKDTRVRPRHSAQAAGPDHRPIVDKVHAMTKQQVFDVLQRDLLRTSPPPPSRSNPSVQ
ncbi:hypothetical protein PCANC_22095 [Puccinia coronata f. sp. avenae]|uniref:Uncharacterized protein n=1 Tax=Puccinia coronata f. sp. avenae TaxID=200324 RepID=A0A2N5SEV5_9BASI|nr:hypothetical protein PCANC_22095 [Puccinia coronata f. sp. avenae]